MLIPLDEAAERIEALGAARAERIVCYCGGGISATMVLFLLHRLGCDNVALHDASMAEWARDETLPIACGQGGLKAALPRPTPRQKSAKFSR